jgi:hypothetical protein
MRRVLIYMAIYGGIGALIGACVALYTADLENVPHKNIVLKNGSAIKASKPHSSSTTPVTPEVAEPTTSPLTEEN